MNIYEIAKLCNVSVATVSRVINGKEGVGQETRQKILSVISERSFQPKIKRTSKDTIAIFVSVSRDNPLSNPFVMKVVEGACDIIFEREFNFTIIPLSRVPRSKEDFKRFCMKHQIGAGIFLTLTKSDRYIIDLADIIPIVTIGSNFYTDKITSVRADNRKGACEMTRYLVSQGHRRILYCVADLSFQDHEDRYLGYRDALQEAGIEFDPIWLLEYDYGNYSDSEIGLMLDMTLENEARRPTAIFCCDDQEAFRIAALLSARGLEIPKDISLAGFDDYDHTRHFYPRLTTVRQPLLEEGRIAARLLCDQLASDGPVKTNELVLETRLIIRKSVSPIH